MLTYLGRLILSNFVKHGDTFLTFVTLKDNLKIRFESLLTARKREGILVIVLNRKRNIYLHSILFIH